MCALTFVLLCCGWGFMASGVVLLVKTSVLVTAVTVIGWGIMKTLTPSPEEFRKVSSLHGESPLAVAVRAL